MVSLESEIRGDFGVLGVTILLAIEKGVSKRAGR